MQDNYLAGDNLPSISNINEMKKKKDGGTWSLSCLAARAP